MPEHMKNTWFPVLFILIFGTDAQIVSDTFGIPLKPCSFHSEISGPDYTTVSERINDTIQPRSIRIVVRHEGEFRNADTIIMRKDLDTTLYIQEFRNGRWEAGSAVFTSRQLRISPENSGGDSVSSWTFRPIEAGTGFIDVMIRNVPYSLIRRITIISLTPPPPPVMRLYEHEGDPTTMAPYPWPPDFIELRKGENKDIVAKMFDHMDYWLSHFEFCELLQNRITWHLTDTNATISQIRGHKTTFSSTVPNHYTVVATYDYEGTTISSTLIVKVTEIRKILVVEPNPITITSDQEFIQVFAILRDEFGNFIGPPPSVIWEVLEPVIVRLEPFVFSSVRVVRIPDIHETSTRIVATDSCSGLSDTATVEIDFVSVIREREISRRQTYGITIEENPVSLFSGRAVIRVSTPEASDLKVAVYDNLGNLLFLRETETRYNGKSDDIIWRLTNRSGAPVGAGTYLIRVEGYGKRSSGVFRYARKLGIYR